MYGKSCESVRLIGRPNCPVGYFVDGKKRLLDLVAAGLLAPFAIPLVLLFASLSWSMGRSAFFGHRRVGRNGQVFVCWKLRTMRPDAEAVLERYLRANPRAAREWAANYKLKNDPRITWLGKWLRRSSIDELPQLWNVVRGDMSMVGPRPVPPKELEEYGTAAWAYLLVRPGITGLWQTSGRNTVCYGTRIRLDVHYVASLSFMADLRILVRTVGEVLRLRGT